MVRLCHTFLAQCDDEWIVNRVESGQNKNLISISYRVLKRIASNTYKYVTNQ